MADITMCEGVGCKSKLTCYRFTAPQNKYKQTYFKETPIVNEGCEYYWNNKDQMLLNIKKLKKQK